MAKHPLGLPLTTPHSTHHNAPKGTHQRGPSARPISDHKPRERTGYAARIRPADDRGGFPNASNGIKRVHQVHTIKAYANLPLLLGFFSKPTNWVAMFPTVGGGACGVVPG